MLFRGLLGRLRTLADASSLARLRVVSSGDGMIPSSLFGFVVLSTPFWKRKRDLEVEIDCIKVEDSVKEGEKKEALGRELEQKKREIDEFKLKNTPLKLEWRK